MRHICYTPATTLFTTLCLHLYYTLATTLFTTLCLHFDYKKCATFATLCVHICCTLATILFVTLCHFRYTFGTLLATLFGCTYTWVVSDMTPYQKWTGDKPDISHIQEFGCIIWIMDKQINPSKLEPKVNKHIHICEI